MSCMYKCKHMLQLDPCNNGRQDGKEDKEKSHQGDNIHCQPSREYLNYLPRIFLLLSTQGHTGNVHYGNNCNVTNCTIRQSSIVALKMLQ